MTVVVFASPKGGVGTTTLACNVAALTAEDGTPTLYVGFGDPRELPLHFTNAPQADWRAGVVDGADLWRSAPTAGRNLQAAFLSDRFDGRGFDLAAQAAAARPGARVIVDAPATPVSTLAPLSEEALVLCVLGADAASLSLAEPREIGDAPLFFVLNQIDQRRRLCRDVAAIVRGTFGADLVAQINFDAVVPEAAANGVLPRDAGPDSDAARSIDALADWVDAALAPARAADASDAPPLTA